jgi:hypothetical protein
VLFCILALRPESNSGAHDAQESKVKVTNEELFRTTALNSWKLVIGRFDQNLAALTDEQLQKQSLPARIGCSTL